MSTEANESRKIDIGQPNSTDVERIVTNNPDAKERKIGWSNREKTFATIAALGALAGGAATVNHFSQSPESTDRDKNPNVIGPAAPGVGVDSGTANTIEPLPSPDSTEILEEQPVVSGEELTSAN